MSMGLTHSYFQIKVNIKQIQAQLFIEGDIDHAKIMESWVLIRWISSPLDPPNACWQRMRLPNAFIREGLQLHHRLSGSASGFMLRIRFVSMFSILWNVPIVLRAVRKATDVTSAMSCSLDTNLWGSGKPSNKFMCEPTRGWSHFDLNRCSLVGMSWFFETPVIWYHWCASYSYGKVPVVLFIIAVLPVSAWIRLFQIFSSETYFVSEWDLHIPLIKGAHLLGNTRLPSIVLNCSLNWKHRRRIRKFHWYAPDFITEDNWFRIIRWKN